MTDRIEQIYKHSYYQRCVEEIQVIESERIFCRHNMEHFLDVARIARIINAEEKLDINKEHIYSAALLHDIGRKEEYEKGVPHEQASGQIAPVILTDSGFTASEINIIVSAILSHRDSAIAKEKSIRGLLYRADKSSRACFACKAEHVCKWNKENKNLTLEY